MIKSIRLITSFRNRLFRAAFGSRIEEESQKIIALAKRKQQNLDNIYIYNLSRHATNVVDYYVFIASKTSDTKKQSILDNAAYFIRNHKYLVVNESTFPTELDKPFVYTKEAKNIPLEFNSPIFPSYNVDSSDNKYSAWSWHLLNTHLSSDKKELIDLYHNRYVSLVNRLKNEKSYKKTYLFGTGPTLSTYKKYKFTNGYKIFCNTTVKDPGIWNDLNPDIIVAADGLFHYSNTEYARQFRADLAKRLDEHKNTFFIYPFIFDSFIRSTPLAAFSDRFIGIPYGNRKEIVTDLVDNFELAELGNALTLMLLPIGASLSKQLYLFGFDGKKPGDKLFWNHSSTHNYQNLMPELQKSHPAFFRYHLPAKNSNKYIKENMDQKLDEMLKQIEKNGWQISLMHHSYTPVLNKRAHNSKQG